MQNLLSVLLALIPLGASAATLVPTPLDGATNVTAAPWLAWTPGENRLSNGGFEQEFTDWTPQPPGSGAGSIRVVTNERPGTLGAPLVLPLEGRFMARLNISEPGNGFIIREFVIPDTGKPVRLTFSEWLRLGTAGAASRPTFEGAYSVALQEAIRTGPPATLKLLRPPLKDQPVLQEWTRRSVDVTEFAGQTVRFVAGGRADFGGMLLLLDDVRLETDPDPDTRPAYDVLLGEGPVLGSGDLLATSRRGAVRTPSLQPGQTYHWQVIERGVEGDRNGPVWRFTVAPRSAATELVLDGPMQPVIAGRPTLAALTALDAAAHLAVDLHDEVRIAALAPTSQVPMVLLTEIAFGSPNGSGSSVEVANVGTGPVSIAGWQLTVWDQARWPTPVATVAFPANSRLEGGRGAVVAGGGVLAGTPPNVNLRQPLFWSARASNQLAAALLRDPAGNIVDFVAVGGADPRAIVEPLPVPAWHWSSGSLRPLTTTLVRGPSWHRLSNRDTHSSEDWGIQSWGMGVVDSRVSRPFQPSPEGREVLPAAVSLIAGSWNGLLTFPQAAENLELVAYTLQGLRTRAALAVDHRPALWVELPERIRENAGVLRNAGRVLIPAPAAADVLVRLESSSPADLAVPVSIIIPAGAREALWDLNVGDDSLRDGSVAVGVTPSAPDFAGVPATVEVNDDETASLELVLPARMTEGSVSAACWVEVVPPPEREVTVSIHIGIPGYPARSFPVSIPAGESRAPFRITAPENGSLDPVRAVEVRAEVTGWTGASGTLALVDNEAATLALSLPFSETEATRVLTNAARVTLGGTLPTNVIIRLTASDPGRVQAPAEVVIPAGALTATFDLTLLDNVVPGGDGPVVVTAAATGFAEGQATLLILDNDAASFAFDPVQSPQLAGQAFSVWLRALGTNGEPVREFSGPVTLTLLGPAGAVPLQTLNTGYNGIGGAVVMVQSEDPVASVRFRADDGQGHSGESNPFDLVEPPFRLATLFVNDAIWHAASARIYAGAMPDGNWANGRIVAFDPVTRQETASVGAVANPSHLIASGGGEFLYVTSTESSSICQYTLPDLTLVRQWQAHHPLTGPMWVADLAVQPGHPEVVAVAGYQPWLPLQAAGVVMFDQGSLRPNVLDVAAQRVHRIEFSPEGDLLYGYDHEVAPLTTTVASTLSRMAVNAEGLAFLDAQPGVTRNDYPYLEFAMYGPVAVFGDGERYLPGTGPGQPLAFDNAILSLVTEPARRRVYGAMMVGSSIEVRTFDADTGRQSGTLNLPVALNPSNTTVRRLIRWGDDGLAIVADGRLAYLRTDLVPGTEPVDLAFTRADLPPSLRIGEPARFSLVLTNLAGTQARRVELQLPWSAEFALENIIVEFRGQRVFEGIQAYEMTVLLGTLQPGEGPEVVVHFTPTVAGPLALPVRVAVNAPESITENNAASGETYVTVDLARNGYAPVALKVHSLAANPVRPRLYAGQAELRRVVELDPFSGRILRSVGIPDPDGFVTFLAVSDDGSRLYVGDYQGNRITEILTESWTIARSWELGSDSASNLWGIQGIAVQPGHPETVAVAFYNYFAAPETRGVQLFDAGVPRGPRVVGAEISHLSFGTDPETLYTITPVLDRIAVRRFRAGPEGLSLDRVLMDSLPGLPTVRVAGGRVYVGDRVFSDDDRFQMLGWCPGFNGFPVFDLGLRAALDPASGLAFLTSMDSSIVGVEVVNLDRLNKIALLSAPKAAEPRTMVRWGTDGLAWSDSQRLHLMRTDWLPNQPGIRSDLSVTLESAGRESPSGELIPLTARVRNLGPDAAPAVRLHWNVKQGILLERPDGSLSDGPADMDLGTLTSGAELLVQVTLRRPVEPVTQALGVRVRSDASDPVTSNQQDGMVLHWIPPAGSPQVLALPGAMNDARWDPVHRRFLITLGPAAGFVGNTLVSFDPITGSVSDPHPAGTVPGHLSLADDGSRLYVGLDGTSSAAVHALPSLEPLLTFDLGLDPNGLLRSVGDAFVIPGKPSEWVTALWHLPSSPFGIPRPRGGGVAMFRDGAKAVREFPEGSQLRVEPGSDGTYFWMANLDVPTPALSRTMLTPEGVGLSSTTASLEEPATDLLRVGPLLIAGNGLVMNAADGSKRGRLVPFPSSPGQPLSTFLCAESAGDIVYVLGPSRIEPPWPAVHAYRTADLSFLGESEPIRSAGPIEGSFQRWGVDGFAHRTFDGLQLWRSSLIPVSDTADWDGDALPDAWELANSTDVHRPDSGADPDGDGLDNAGEFIAGTAANNAESRFDLILETLPEGTRQGRFFGRHGRSYQLQRSPALDGSWTSPGEPIGGAEQWIVLPLAGSESEGFFRVLVSLR